MKIKEFIDGKYYIKCCGDNFDRVKSILNCAIINYGASGESKPSLGWYYYVLNDIIESVSCPVFPENYRQAFVDTIEIEDLVTPKPKISIYEFNTGRYKILVTSGNIDTLLKISKVRNISDNALSIGTYNYLEYGKWEAYNAKLIQNEVTIDQIDLRGICESKGTYEALPMPYYATKLIVVKDFTEGNTAERTDKLKVGDVTWYWFTGSDNLNNRKFIFPEGNRYGRSLPTNCFKLYDKPKEPEPSLHDSRYSATVAPDNAHKIVLVKDLPEDFKEKNPYTKRMKVGDLSWYTGANFSDLKRITKTFWIEQARFKYEFPVDCFELYDDYIKKSISVEEECKEVASVALSQKETKPEIIGKRVVLNTVFKLQKAPLTEGRRICN